MGVAAFVEKWSASSASERANKDLFLSELCDVLGVPRPDAATGDITRDLYVFEKPVPMRQEGGKTTIKRVDLYKHACFLLEAKQGADPGHRKAGTGRRGTQSWDLAMVDARGQALAYASALDSPPPFIIVCDIGYVFELYADFDGTHRWPAFPNAQNRRLYLRDLPKHVETLRAIFTDPHSLDPARRAEKVTRDVAQKLAELARRLEGEKNPPESVAKFLMRCLFTMFAQSVGLLPHRTLTDAIEHHWLPNHRAFPGGIQALWEAMNSGAHFGFIGKLLRFNGGLFAQPTPLPLSKESLAQLLDAARYDWSEVDPAIFGTLLARALDPEERHRLGAHYTPRAYVERLVRHTIEIPLREDWENVQTAARKLYMDGKADEARKTVRAFHERLCETKVLDPACGSGNFLYVTLDLFKRIESEVLALLNDLGERQELLHATGIRVTPGQFLGIEIKPWAKEIAELVLWIGYLQWHYRTSGKLTPPPEPVLQDYQNMECRDALISWELEEIVRDAKGEPLTRWDGETKKKHPVTGEMVPDADASTIVYRYINPRKAPWPACAFVIGNPPFIGNKRMRQALGDGYVEAVRGVYQEVPDTSDLVMYWWHRAADLLKDGNIRRFGFITTNSVTQTQGRKVIESHLTGEPPLSIVFAMPDHPWVDTADGAAVRIAMTTVTQGELNGTVGTTTDEVTTPDGHVEFEIDTRIGRVNADLSIGADVASAKKLRANSGLCFQGYILVGKGFVLDEDGARQLGVNPRKSPAIIHPWKNGKDLLQGNSNRYVIDLFGLTESEARSRYPKIYQHLLTTVKPHRDQAARKNHRDRWWIWGEPRPGMRKAVQGLERIIVTNFAAKHRVFVFEDPRTAIDHNMYVIAIDDALILGVLSSRVHLVWMLAAGSTLEDRPLWINSTCFLPFPFPACTKRHERDIRTLAESIDAHRKRQQAIHDGLTITGMYNVLDKLRRGEHLSSKDQLIHDSGLVSTLRRLHDSLDAAVFSAYGWECGLTDDEILRKLVDLNAERAAEEGRGVVRWLRADLQNPTGAQQATQTRIDAVDETVAAGETAAVGEFKPWPRKLPLQIAAVRDRLGMLNGFFTVDDVARAFKGARRKDIADLLDGLASLGVLTSVDDGYRKRWRSGAIR